MGVLLTPYRRDRVVKLGTDVVGERLGDCNFDAVVYVAVLEWVAKWQQKKARLGRLWLLEQADKTVGLESRR